MKFTRITFCLLVALLSPGASTLAQVGGFAGEFTRIGFGPRGMALGNAMVAVADEGSYAHYNPALAARPDNGEIQLDISTSIMEFDRQLHNVNAKFRISPTANLSIGLINARVTDIDGRTASGFRTESLSTDEYQVLSNFGFRFSETIWGGIGFKINFADFANDVSTTTSVGIDTGIYAEVIEGLTVGAAIQDLFASYDTDTSDLFGDNAGSTEQNFPTRFKFGAAYRPHTEWLVSTEYEIRSQSSDITRSVTELFEGVPTIRTVTDEVTTSSQFLRFGSSWMAHERITVRSGFQLFDLENDTESVFSAGFSLHLPFDKFSPSVDYAFFREPNNISSIHVFALRLHL